MSQMAIFISHVSLMTRSMDLFYELRASTNTFFFAQFVAENVCRIFSLNPDFKSLADNIQLLFPWKKAILLKDNTNSSPLTQLLSLTGSEGVDETQRVEDVPSGATSTPISGKDDNEDQPQPEE